MIVIKNGDLLKSDCNIIIHQANCMGKMGAGIAKQIARVYPEAYVADKEFYIPVGNRERLGKYSVASTQNGKRIYNMYSQFHYGRGLQTDYDAFEQAFRMILIDAIHSGINDIKIGMPYGIGCNLAGGNWDVVSKIIEKISDEKNWLIYLYKI